MSWKVVPCCLQSPDSTTVPTKGLMDQLVKIGLGIRWFSSDDKLDIDLYLTEGELHFLFICLFPVIPYEICKATGPGNTVICTLAN